jgi:Na+/H+ antiporter NhaD/arsenite permease-like protein
MKERITVFLKNEVVFCAALVLTVLSMLIVPPSGAYAGYLNYSVLALLFCLMSVVQGFKQQGVFDVLSSTILSRTKSLRIIAVLLMSLCFFSAMLVTNDVALLTFVPFTLILLGEGLTESELIFVIVIETIAANLGSMVTPIGNPQNLYIYYYYQMKIGEFFRLLLPYGMLSYVLLFLVTWLRLPDQNLYVKMPENGIKNKRKLVKYILLFLLCLLTVLKLVDYRVCFGITLVCLYITDRSLLRAVDYVLLLTFVCFFIFVGNISSIESVRTFMLYLTQDRTLPVAVLLSQVISNVPAAAMLSGFTQDYRGLLLGVDFGGLGTLIASLASLISYKFYVKAKPAQIGMYMKVFTVYNVGFLAVLILLSFFF